MKVLHLIVGICFVHQIRAQSLTAECMKPEDLLNTVVRSCVEFFKNDWLWQEVINCHVNITDQYLRNSSETLCPEIRFADDPTNTTFPMQIVFRNICGLLMGTNEQNAKGMNCLVNGTDVPFRMSHRTELDDVKSKFGDDVPCGIGICINKLFNITQT